MDEFVVRCAAGGGSLAFFARAPLDRSHPITQFQVRITDVAADPDTCLSDRQLLAVGSVFAGHSEWTFSHPAGLFAEMGRRWKGWQDELAWRSLEGELTLRCTRDRLSHISMRAVLRSGFMPEDWRVEATIMTEAGQLEGVARQATEFFGHPVQQYVPPVPPLTPR